MEFKKGNIEENHKKGKKKENHTTGKPLKQKGKWEKKKNRKQKCFT